MILKKYGILFLALICCSNLVACNSTKGKMINSRLNELNNYYKVSDKRSKAIINALENKDKEALKNLFSLSALKLSKNIDENIEYIMNFFEGEITSIDGGPGYATSSKSNGVSVSEDTYKYTISTTDGNYFLFFIYISKDTFNKENEGMYIMQLIKEEDKKKEYDGGNAIRCPGIYVPPVSQYTDIKFEDGTEIAGGFKFLNYREDHSDGKFNIYATIQSEIAYGDISISFCFYDKNGEKIGVARQSSKNAVEAGGVFEVNLTAHDYDNKDLKYEDISSIKFFGIEGY